MSEVCLTLNLERKWGVDWWAKIYEVLAAHDIKAEIHPAARRGLQIFNLVFESDRDAVVFKMFFNQND